MKTKDFIAMLQEADPTGEGYIRLPGGGAPYCADAKEGYWDGAYQYLERRDENDKYFHDGILVTSVKGYKVDIGVKDTSDIVWEEYGDMEKLKTRFRFDMNMYADPKQRQEKIDRHWKYIEEQASYARDYREKSIEEWTKKVIDSFVDTEYELRQPLENPIGYYNCITAHGMFSKNIHLCQGECMGIIESGKFYPEKTDKYYIWKYDPAKGQKWSIK